MAVIGAETETHGGITPPIAWFPIVAGIVLFALFVRHAWFADRPLIDVRLFRTTGFSAAAASTFLLAGAVRGDDLAAPLLPRRPRRVRALRAAPPGPPRRGRRVRAAVLARAHTPR